MWSPFVHAGGHCRALCAVFCFVVLTPGGLTTPDLSSGTYTNLERSLCSPEWPPRCCWRWLWGEASGNSILDSEIKGILVVRKKKTHTLGTYKAAARVLSNLITLLTNILQWISNWSCYISTFSYRKGLFCIPFVFPVGDLESWSRATNLFFLFRLPLQIQPLLLVKDLLNNLPSNMLEKTHEQCKVSSSVELELQRIDWHEEPKKKRGLPASWVLSA